MKKLDRKEGIIHFNRITGAYGSTIYMPDNVDLMEWVELPVADVREWEHGKEARDAAIKEAVESQLAEYENVAAKRRMSDISVDVKDITVDEAVYEEFNSCKKMLAKHNIFMYSKDIDTKDVIERTVSEFNEKMRIKQEQGGYVNTEDMNDNKPSEESYVDYEEVK